MLQPVGHKKSFVQDIRVGAGARLHSAGLQIHTAFKTRALLASKHYPVSFAPCFTMVAVLGSVCLKINLHDVERAFVMTGWGLCSVGGINRAKILP